MPSALTAPPASIAQHQAELRRLAAERRSALAARESPASAGARAAENLLAEMAVRAEAVVSAFWPMGDEIDPRPLIRRLHDGGVSICLPVVVARGAALMFRRWTPATRFVPGGFKTMVPSPDEPELVPSFLIVPLLAFDAEGYRLGYGGGFYDRTLAKLRAGGAAVAAVGFAYAGQEVESVPHADYDQRIDRLASEQGLRRFG